jgi:uncharacterized RDD family membrane protein YckC
LLTGEGAAWSRAGAIVIDSLLLAVVWFIVAVISGGTHAGHGSAGAHTGSSTTLLVLGITLLYFFVAESLTGQTLGKKLTGIRVVRRDGGKAGAGAIFVRTLLRVIDALPAFYLLGLVTILLSGKSRRQRIGDIAANTVVTWD